MPSINFMERFAGPVERGEKLQTIRRLRKRPIKVGDTLQLYTGQRSKACRRLGVGRCTRVRAIQIGLPGNPGGITLDGLTQTQWRRWQLAEADGFEFIEDFTAFFAGHYGLPFTGVLIEWEMEGKGDD